MQIETKHNVGEHIFRMRENKVFEDTIIEICINVSRDGVVSTLYTLQYGGGGYSSNSFFTSKEDLLKSL